MPGGRLTDEDRRDIASGLTRGLGYAEIARRLGRPTSTVTREVSRNGGARDYRADRAHQAARRRARRRRSAAPHEPPAVVGAEGRDPAAVSAFAEEFAASMVRMGLPRMAARVLASLLTTDAGALTAAELTDRLRVSPASVSKAVGYLEGLEVLRRERGVRRRERYFVDDDVWLRTWLTSARTNEVLAETAGRGAEVLDPATPAGARMRRMGRFFAQLGDDMAGGPSSVVGDVVTVLSALVRAVTPDLADRLAAELGWPPDRVAEALRDAAHVTR
ncbi:helix-turn-helix domain-containing protein [Saccharothrix sp. 6-C]|uniref:GbsR/MarR family transcriptional regulator n=1 Tax=Saccharothrix sp. 6-C TaxID=2781735 RepID=UPI001916E65E|nr:helix-turn-helix domain-containing protein [Saccharothrix sp. 6-C]QQQ73388.1 helix-turn-helix domain-containing protein [Saccharothrix sp. 6-C]